MSAKKPAKAAVKAKPEVKKPVTPKTVAKVVKKAIAKKVEKAIPKTPAKVESKPTVKATAPVKKEVKPVVKAPAKPIKLVIPEKKETKPAVKHTGFAKPAPVVKVEAPKVETTQARKELSMTLADAMKTNLEQKTIEVVKQEAVQQTKPKTISVKELFEGMQPPSVNGFFNK